MHRRVLSVPDGDKLQAGKPRSRLAHRGIPVSSVVTNDTRSMLEECLTVQEQPPQRWLSY